MMQRVVNTTRSFAYVPNFTSYRANVGDVCLIANLVEVEFMAGMFHIILFIAGFIIMIFIDGRCILEAKLSHRHKIIEHLVEDGTQGLHFCRSQVFQDDELSATDNERAIELKELSYLLVK
jgi:hypothetical protein